MLNHFGKHLHWYIRRSPKMILKDTCLTWSTVKSSFCLVLQQWRISSITSSCRWMAVNLNVANIPPVHSYGGQNRVFIVRCTSDCLEKHKLTTRVSDLRSCEGSWLYRLVRDELHFASVVSESSRLQLAEEGRKKPSSRTFATWNPRDLADLAVFAFSVADEVIHT